MDKHDLSRHAENAHGMSNRYACNVDNEENRENPFRFLGLAILIMPGPLGKSLAHELVRVNRFRS